MSSCVPSDPAHARTHGHTYGLGCAASLPALIQGIASNFDDAERGPNVRLTVEGQPEVLVRFSQRGLNTVIIGIWCACSARKCVDWLRRVLYVGGDADTVGAVAGQIACPLLPLDDVVEAYKRAVALEEMTSKSAQVNQQAAKRFFQRSCLFVLADWPQLLQTPRLIDPAYEGFTTEDGMRVAGHCRTPCKFGGKCYEKKPNHRVQYSHPGDEDWQRLPCRYARCRDGSGGSAGV
ncbi:unnamed protein product [Effrenium voratum]|nr:unnamed protein product [Effrenium voratum]